MPTLERPTLAAFSLRDDPGVRARSLLGVGILLSVVAVGCYGPSSKNEPPLGFGVDNESHFSRTLDLYGFSKLDADCVAHNAFARNPTTSNYSDGSFDVTQKMLREAGKACGIDWSDYDFEDD